MSGTYRSKQTNKPENNKHRDTGTTRMYLSIVSIILAHTFDTVINSVPNITPFTPWILNKFLDEEI